MLRLMIGSDIHRRLDHLKEALDDARSEGVLDAILLAGDFETAQEDIDRLDIPESLYLVHGNNDALLAPSDPADELVIDIEDNRISGVHAAGYTDPLPPRPASSVHRILMTHGHRYHAPRLLALRAPGPRGGSRYSGLWAYAPLSGRCRQTRRCAHPQPRHPHAGTRLGALHLHDPRDRRQQGPSPQARALNLETMHAAPMNRDCLLHPACIMQTGPTLHILVHGTQKMFGLS